MFNSVFEISLTPPLTWAKYIYLKKEKFKLWEDTFLKGYGQWWEQCIIHHSTLPISLSFSPLLPSHCFVDRDLLCSERSVLFKQMLTFNLSSRTHCLIGAIHPSDSVAIWHSSDHLAFSPGTMAKNIDIRILPPPPPPAEKNPTN